MNLHVLYQLTFQIPTYRELIQQSFYNDLLLLLVFGHLLNTLTYQVLTRVSRATIIILQETPFPLITDLTHDKTRSHVC